jgi:hypothetical protein
MRELAYKHFFTVTDGKFNWESPDMFELCKRNLEGKRGYAIIEEDTPGASRNQLAYYFGGIIRKECMNSNTFGGMKEKEIHSILLQEVRGTMRNITMKDGSLKVVETVPDFNEIVRSKTEMAKYINEVIMWLVMECDINPKPAEHYKYNKFQIDLKHYT